MLQFDISNTLESEADELLRIRVIRVCCETDIFKGSLNRDNAKRERKSQYDFVATLLQELCV